MRQADTDSIEAPGAVEPSRSAGPGAHWLDVCALEDIEPAGIEVVEEWPAEADAPPAVAAEVDPVLQDIFRKETAGHVAAIRDYIDGRSRDRPPHPVTDALYRACHTLSGVAAM